MSKYTDLHKSSLAQLGLPIKDWNEEVIRYELDQEGVIQTTLYSFMKFHS